MQFIMHESVAYIMQYFIDMGYEKSSSVCLPVPFPSPFHFPTLAGILEKGPRSVTCPGYYSEELSEICGIIWKIPIDGL